MALIIKGNMPTCCGLCWECLGGGSDAYYCNRAKRQISEVVPPYDKRMEWCPIVGEIPDEYGRLIDADIVADYYFDYLRVCSPLMNMEKAMEMVNTVKEACKIAPTVLEAST